MHRTEFALPLPPAEHMKKRKASLLRRGLVVCPVAKDILHNVVNELTTLSASEMSYSHPAHCTFLPAARSSNNPCHFTHHLIHHHRPVCHKGSFHGPSLARTGCGGMQHEVGHGPSINQNACLERWGVHGHATVPVPPAVRVRGAGVGQGCWIHLGCWLWNTLWGIRGP